MEHVRRHGYPVPEVYSVSGGEMEMERVDGPSLLDVAAKEPHRVRAHAFLLAELHHRLHQIPAPPDIEQQVGDGNSTLHLDLQPANVVITRDGPVVLDWGWAAGGSPAADAAHTWLQLATSEVPGGVAVRLLGRLGRGVFVRAFLKHFDASVLRRALPVVAEYRLARRELTDAERGVIPRFVAAQAR